MNTPASKVKPRNVVFGLLDIADEEGGERTLLLNNVSIKYIADTGASMSVISEDTARKVNAKIRPYDKSKIRAMTADGKEVKDVLCFAEVEVTLGNQS